MLRLRLARPVSLPSSCSRIVLLLLLAVVCANVYRRLVYDQADLYHCNKLLHQGQFLDSPDRSPERKPFQNWQVPACLIHDYTASDIADCNEDGQVLFVGDTTVRQIFWATAGKLNYGWVGDRRQELDKHEDLYLEVGNARLRFMWDPWLNSTGFSEELKAYMDRNKSENSNSSKNLQSSDGKRRSVLLFIGGGLWHARHLGDEYLSAFNHAVDRVAAVMSTTHDRLTSPANIRAHGNDGVDDQIFFAPVPNPIVDRLSPSRMHTITPNKIRAMNDHLQLWSNRGLNVPWSYQDMTANWPEAVGESGLHVTDRIATHMANVVLNYRCNAKAAQKNGFPFDKTCCSAYRQANWVQTVAFVLSVPLFALAAYGRFVHNTARSTMVVITDASAMFLLAAMFCFIADRTHIFDKVPKEFANIDFRVTFGAAVMLCLLNIQSLPAASTKSQKRSPEKAARSAPFLPREQSDEFKGWMQIYVLVYAYTGATNVMDFYKVFRVFIALYLLLSGYGHATYFLQTNDFSLRRVMGVVLRINMLPVFLALIMERPYSAYHFPPLVTFWFLAVFLTLRIGQRWNKHLGVLFVKVVIAALLTTMLINARGGLETLASVFSTIFRANIDVGELRFNLGTDNYVVFVGVMVAASHVNIRSTLRTPNRQLSVAGLVVKRYFLLHQVLLIAFAVITIPTFWLLAQQKMKNKGDYNWWMPYLAWLPALSFVVLRNVTSFLRGRYCTSLAWLGRISLELYLLSQHIWLAGDGQGVLRIGFRYGNGTFLGDKWRDLAVLSPIFVWLAWKVHEATKVFTAWLLYGQAAMKEPEQAGRPASGDVMELPGWHRPEDDRAGDAESRRRAQSGERKELLSRLGGVAVAIWLINVFYL